MERLETLILRVRNRINLQEEVEGEALKSLVSEVLLEAGREFGFSVEEKVEYERRIWYALEGFDVLQELLEEDGVTEIMVNGASRIFYEKDGRLRLWEKSFSSEERLSDVIQRMVSQVNRMVNTASPIVDARLPDGSRLHVVLPPIALNGPTVTIRRFAKEPITMEKLVEWKSISREAADFLQKLVCARYNLFISGGTGSGKTTFLNALSQWIPPEERVITIEDSAELQLLNLPNLVRLECRMANVSGENAVSIRDLIRASLRMRPTRIIVGEVRGEEALDMLQAMNTGHDGSLSTGHSNQGVEDMLNRLAVMVLMGCELPLAAIKAQIASALDIVVHLERDREGRRKVYAVEEIIGIEDGEIKTQPLFVRKQDELVAAGNTLCNRKKWDREFESL